MDYLVRIYSKYLVSVLLRYCLCLGIVGSQKYVLYFANRGYVLLMFCHLHEPIMFSFDSFFLVDVNLGDLYLFFSFYPSFL